MDRWYNSAAISSTYSSILRLPLTMLFFSIVGSSLLSNMSFSVTGSTSSGTSKYRTRPAAHRILAYSVFDPVSGAVFQRTPLPLPSSFHHVVVKILYTLVDTPYVDVWWSNHRHGRYSLVVPTALSWVHPFPNLSHPLLQLYPQCQKTVCWWYTAFSLPFLCILIKQPLQPPLLCLFFLQLVLSQWSGSKSKTKKLKQFVNMDRQF